MGGVGVLLVSVGVSADGRQAKLLVGGHGGEGAQEASGLPVPRLRLCKLGAALERLVHLGQIHGSLAEQLEREEPFERRHLAVLAAAEAADRRRDLLVERSLLVDRLLRVQVRLARAPPQLRGGAGPFF